MTKMMICIKYNNMYIKKVAIFDKDKPINHSQLKCKIPITLNKEDKMYIVPMSSFKIKRITRRKNYYDIDKNDIKILVRKNTYNEEKCVICQENKPNIVYFPCSHNCVCKDCDKKMNGNKCPLCRREIIIKNII